MVLCYQNSEQKLHVPIYFVWKYCLPVYTDIHLGTYFIIHYSIALCESLCVYWSFSFPKKTRLLRDVAAIIASFFILTKKNSHAFGILGFFGVLCLSYTFLLSVHKNLTQASMLTVFLGLFVASNWRKLIRLLFNSQFTFSPHLYIVH